MLSTIIFAAIAAPIMMPVPSAVVSARGAGPGDRFAAELVARADLGFRLRGMEITRDAGAPSLEIVMSDGRIAHRFELDYPVDGSKPVAYRWSVVKVPPQARIYDVERELVKSLRVAAPGLLSEEEGGVRLEAGAQTLWIDGDAYHTVSVRAAGTSADTVAADALTRSLAAGYDLVDIRGSRDGGAPVIDLWLAGETWRVVHIVTDRHGRVGLVEVREKPAREAYRTYLHRDELLAELELGRALHSLVLEPTASGGERLVGVMRAGVRITIEPDAFEDNELEYGC